MSMQFLSARETTLLFSTFGGGFFIGILLGIFFGYGFLLFTRVSHNINFKYLPERHRIFLKVVVLCSRIMGIGLMGIGTLFVVYILYISIMLKKDIQFLWFLEVIVVSILATGTFMSPIFIVKWLNGGKPTNLK